MRKKELRDFFRAVDHYPSHPLTNRHLVDPLLFRMMYGCGLRLGEALLLKLGDVDIEQGCNVSRYQIADSHTI